MQFIKYVQFRILKFTVIIGLDPIIYQIFTVDCCVKHGNDKLVSTGITVW